MIRLRYGLDMEEIRRRYGLGTKITNGSEEFTSLRVHRFRSKGVVYSMRFAMSDKVQIGSR